MKKKSFYFAALCFAALMTAVAFTSCSDDDSEETENKEDTPATQYPEKAIDLGLSVRWASCNVGATKPEEFGGYYAWGETEEKDWYDWSNYSLCDGTAATCHKIGDIRVDTRYDVARKLWGHSWRIPSYSEVKELIEKCKWEWKDGYNGVSGYLVTGPKGNSIFIPSAGYRYDTPVHNVGKGCYLWSSVKTPDVSHAAYGAALLRDGFHLLIGQECYMGLNIRPVME